MESDSEMKGLEDKHAKAEAEQIGPGRADSCSADPLGSSGFVLSVVVPVYKEEGNVPEFIARMTRILGALTASFEIIFALDPSPDRPEEIIVNARAHDSRIKLLKFSRRFGQPIATIAGLQYSSGDAVIVMDVDLQDPPQLVVQMVEKWKQGYDVVYAQRRSRDGETWIKKVVSGLGYKSSIGSLRSIYRQTPAIFG
jgi:dolichol-phosphate mannosyltransferase